MQGRNMTFGRFNVYIYIYILQVARMPRLIQHAMWAEIEGRRCREEDVGMISM